MSADTGTQFAYLAPAERVLAAADMHMSGCDAPTVFECTECTRKITKYRKYLAALADAGLLLPPGGETRTEWGIAWTQPSTALDAGAIRYSDFRDQEDYDEDEGGEAAARSCVDWHQAHPAGNKGVRLASHTIHTTPWREVPSGTTPTGGNNQEAG